MFVLYVNCPLNILDLLKNGQFQPILVAIFVTIATVKVEFIRDFFHLGYCSNKPIKAN